MDWETLRDILMQRPEMSLHGVVEARGKFAEEEPPVEIWRQGPRVRVEDDGTPVFISDGTTVWDFDSTNRVNKLSGTPLTGPADENGYWGPFQTYAKPRDSWDWWSGSDYDQPVSAVTIQNFRDRDCWTVALQDPSSTLGPLRLWVDQESGYLVGMASEKPEDGDTAHWIADLDIGASLSADLFTWDGPTVTKDEVDAARSRQTKARQDEELAWFRRHVTEASLRVPARLNLPPLPEDIDPDGTFSTRNNTALVRRVSEADWVNVMQPKLKLLSWISWSNDDFRTGVLILNAAVVHDDGLRDALQQHYAGQPPEAADKTPVAVTLDLTPVSVPFRDDATGEFDAIGNDFSLKRVSRAVTPEETTDSPWPEEHRWSTPDFDWSLRIGDEVHLDRDGLEALQQQLHPGVEIDRSS
ncbi:MAG TPA: hypothetical protein H9870_06075 [Candidatus Corynebacterium avicola]|uniref:Uncharacterized protein n=1 Tax=Candidatus Corynebacterium avicola TaxID=2838527 RepID=A0A9D1RP67_9CORY|nr:hypothetical protein [Candidatus Corynebacterium avicola]